MAAAVAAARVARTVLPSSSTRPVVAARHEIGRRVLCCCFMRTSCEHVMSYHEHVHVTDVSHDVAAVKHIARPWWARSDEGLSAQWPAQWPAIMGPRKPTFFPPPFFFGPPFPKMEGFGLQTYFPRIGHDEPATIKFTRRSHHQVHQGGGVHTARSGRVSFSTCMYYNHCECRQ
jgi:hypothetical protein